MQQNHILTEGSTRGQKKWKPENFIGTNDKEERPYFACILCTRNKCLNSYH